MNIYEWIYNEWIYIEIYEIYEIQQVRKALKFKKYINEN